MCGVRPCIMPTPGKAWYHITVGTYSSWLPGDPRGFRSRDHRIHSSGHHRAPPPKGEHEALHHHAKQLSGKAVKLTRQQRSCVGPQMLQNFLSRGNRVLAISVSALHVHILIQLPQSSVKREIGYAKRQASFALRGQIKGRLWARDCGIKPIKNRSHHQQTYRYILDHEQEDAWVWSYRNSDADDIWPPHT